MIVFLQIKALEAKRGCIETNEESNMQLKWFYKQNKWFYVKAGMTQPSKIALSTPCALVWMKWSWLGIWGIGVRPDRGNDLAKQLNSETVTIWNHNK